MKKLAFILIAPLLLAACQPTYSTQHVLGEVAEQPTPELVITQHNGAPNNLDGVNVNCTVRNNSDKLVEIAYVDAAFKDKSGVLVGTGVGSVSNIPAHGERSLTVRSHDVVGASNYDLSIATARFHE